MKLRLALATLLLGSTLGLFLAAQEAKPAAPPKVAPAQASSDDPDEVKPRPAKPKTPKSPARKKSPKLPYEKRVDVNIATKEQLKKLPGIDDGLAARIISIRPIRSKADLVTKGAIPQGLYFSIKDLIAAGPFPTPK